MSPSVSRNRPEVTGSPAFALDGAQSSRRTRAGHMITRNSPPSTQQKPEYCRAPRILRSAHGGGQQQQDHQRTGPSRGANIPASQAGNPAGTLNPVPAAPSARAAARAIPSRRTWCCRLRIPQPPASVGHPRPAPPAGGDSSPHGQQRPPALPCAQPTSPQSPGGYFLAGVGQGSLRAGIRFPALRRAERLPIPCSLSTGQSLWLSRSEWPFMAPSVLQVAWDK